MVTLTVDGKEVQVPKGTNIIEAARKAGIDIPYLCYHHQLTPFGGCRLCLVEVEKMPRLTAACNTLVMDGMAVHTTSAKVASQRAGSLEFILLNHPLDCPVCDKGGECELQDRVFGFSNAKSRMTEPKIHVEDYDLGPLIVRNQDRCIICKRCVKVMEEIVGDPVLEFGQRGVTTEVYTFEHAPFEAGFSGNTIRVCPVGALMSKPFRFKARPWELIKTPSVCSLCSVGCNLREDTRENQLLRVVGIENPHVNDGWLCDRGQFGYDYVQSPDRLTAPLVRQANGQFEAVSWETALAEIVKRLQGVTGDSFAAIGSERTTNEDCFALQKFTREVMGSANIDHRMGSTRQGYAQHRPEPGAITALAQADVLLLVGTDLTADAPVLDLVLKRTLLPKRLKLIVANPRRAALNRFASQWLRYTPGQEIALVNALVKATLEQGLVAEELRSGPDWESLNKGLSRSLEETCRIAGITEADARAAATLFAGAKLGSIVVGQTALDARDGAYVQAALQNLALLAGQAEKPGHQILEAVTQANTWGARDQGVLPDVGPGGKKTQRGLGTGEILQSAAGGKLRALWVSGANPLVDFPGGRAREALSKVPLLVVQDLFLTETARMAHVVLPAAAIAERGGTLTNIEGRTQRIVRALDPRGAAMQEWSVLNMVSEDLGRPMGLGTAAAVAKAMSEAGGAAGSGAAAVTGLQRVETPALPNSDQNFPLWLFTGRLMFDRSALQRHSQVLPGLAPDPFVELHPQDAARAGLNNGDAAVVESPYGKLAVQVAVTDAVPVGSAFVPTGYDEAPAAFLWVEGTSVVHGRVSRRAG
jgi:NADH-quinone oxidoreductase chain G